MCASMYGHAGVVGQLLGAQGIEVNATDILGNTAPIRAKRYGHAEIENMLRDRGHADIVKRLRYLGAME